MDTNITDAYNCRAFAHKCADPCPGGPSSAEPRRSVQRGAPAVRPRSPGSPSAEPWRSVSAEPLRSVRGAPRAGPSAVRPRSRRVVSCAAPHIHIRHMSYVRYLSRTTTSHVHQPPRTGCPQHFLSVSQRRETTFQKTYQIYRLYPS